MATSDTTADSSTGNRTAPSVRHTKEDALSDLEFERLYTASYDLDRFQDVESWFILMVGGRLGLRRGEIAHMDESWVDWRKRRLEIPRFVDCDRGRDNRACGACRQHAQQMAEHNDDVSFQEALDSMWQPKTDNAVRAVPYGFSPRVELVLNEFFDECDRWMYSGQAINRRVDWLAEAAGLERNVYPHALRATAATYLAGRGMSTIGLQSMMGWAQPSTAQDYIATSADNTERELHMING